MLLPLSGCVLLNWERPPVEYTSTGEVKQYKRYERHMERDVLHRFARQVYAKTDAIPFNLSPSALNVLQQIGQPDYMRRKFRSLEQERVEEWLYLDRGEMYQFVRGALVYEGPITDYELTLLRLGYPDRHKRVIVDFAPPRAYFYYKSAILADRMDAYIFEGDKLISQTELN